MVAAMAAGFGAWAIGESFYGYFRAPMRQVSTMGYISFRATPADLVAANVKNAAVPYGVLGGLVGMALGLAGGLSRRDFRAAAVAGGVGAVVGVVLTVLLTVPSLLGYWSYFGENPLTEELLVPLLTHAVSWAGVGVAGGLALAVGVGGGRPVLWRLALAGLVGAVVGTGGNPDAAKVIGTSPDDPAYGASSSDLMNKMHGDSLKKGAAKKDAPAK